MKLPKFFNLKQYKKALIATIIVVLCIGGAGYAYFGRNTSNVYNSSGYGTNNPKNPITTTSSDKSTAGTITVAPCSCKLKNTQTQPGQNSTSGTSLQNGSSGTTQIQTCNPCPVDSSAAASSAVLCPEYMCKAPTPAPVPTPTPTPTPAPTPPTGCGTCGGGYRKTGTSSPMVVCPMICFQ